MAIWHGRHHPRTCRVMRVVAQRDAATLLPTIQQPGTEIWSDQQRCHMSTCIHVNHSLHFKDPVTGVHTKHIESYWGRVKTKLKRIRGCNCHQRSSYYYLDEFVWFERHDASVLVHMSGHRFEVSCLRIINNNYILFVLSLILTYFVIILT